MSNYDPSAFSTPLPLFPLPFITTPLPFPRAAGKSICLMSNCNPSAALIWDRYTVSVKSVTPTRGDVIPPAFHIVSELSWHDQNVSKADWPRNTFIVLCLITTPLPLKRSAMQDMQYSFFECSPKSFRFRDSTSS